ncbi:MAG: hypothetical protein DMG24_05270 [Acidobacteria bacterium]|nr:MAG: hypothetical protein DMG24_05270 [Acidobacteriota bacterium]
MLDDAGRVSDPQVAEGIRTMVSVVKDQAVLCVDGVQEIGAEADSNPYDAHEVAMGPIILEMAGFERHDSEKAQIV